MKTFKGTKEGWTTGMASEGTDVYSVFPDGSHERICNVFDNQSEQANAKLIAAAPKMFKLIVLSYQGEIWIHEIVAEVLGEEITYEEMIELKESFKKALN